MKEYEMLEYLDDRWSIEPITETMTLWNFIPATGNDPVSFCASYRIDEFEQLTQSSMMEFKLLKRDNSNYNLQIGETTFQINNIDSNSFKLTSEKHKLELKRRRRGFKILLDK